MSLGSRSAERGGGILGPAMAKVRIQEVRRLLFPVETAVDAVLELDRRMAANWPWES